jgi:hypothetical protein
MGDQIALFGSTSKQFLLQPLFGHVDHYTTADHRMYVEEPILNFVTHVFGR